MGDKAKDEMLEIAAHRIGELVIKNHYLETTIRTIAAIAATDEPVEWRVVRIAGLSGACMGRLSDSPHQALRCSGDALNAVVGSLPDLPDCTDPFTKKARENVICSENANIEPSVNPLPNDHRPAGN